MPEKKILKIIPYWAPQANFLKFTPPILGATGENFENHRNKWSTSMGHMISGISGFSSHLAVQSQMKPDEITLGVCDTVVIFNKL